MMSDDATFKDQIEKVAKKVRQKTGWVLRTFYSRKTLLMKTLFKTLVVPHIDYCSQLWMPVKPVEIQCDQSSQAKVGGADPRKKLIGKNSKTP